MNDCRKCHHAFKAHSQMIERSPCGLCNCDGYAEPKIGPRILFVILCTFCVILLAFIVSTLI